jgi:cytochrome c peroxidase
MKMRTTTQAILFLGLLLTQMVNAHGPLPVSLKGAPIPPLPAGLVDGSDPIIINQQKAIILGKALFWDMAIGSDGVACASCHFHAGADSRIKNQLNPGDKNPAPSGGTFEAVASGAVGGPNHTLTRNDFPFHQRQNPFSDLSPITFDTDDVASSSGTFSGEYNGAPRTGDVNDECTRDPDPVFHVNSVGTRRVEPRNTPTMINAVFNHRNFWDGRANNTFNGSSIWGDRDTDAGVWVKINGRTVQKQRLALINSSLASQALAPPLSDTEMGCRQRTFKELGRKLLFRRPLEHQKVHHQDSVLGGLSFSSGGDLQPGLNTTYSTLIRQTFNKKYWSYRRRGAFGGIAGQRPYTQMEANFSMFFGLAIQMYESTLISDDSPFDNATFDANTLPTNLGDSVRRGVVAFEELHCNVCHSGPVLTSNAIHTNAQMLEDNPQAFGLNVDQSGVDGVAINRNIINYDNANGSKFFDTGFANTGVQDPNGDPGLGGSDDFGNSLSFSSQYAEYLAGTINAIIDIEAGISNTKTCNFQIFFASNRFIPPFITITEFFRPADGIIADPNGSSNCYNAPSEAFVPAQAIAAVELADPNSKKMAFATQAAFKVPSLRNVELTGPYMHNGSMATLEEVIEFYARGGNFHNSFIHEFVTPIGQLGGTDPVVNATAIQKRADLIAFLKSLTDDRVRYERAPFDHPELSIAHGHTGDAVATTDSNPLDASLAADDTLTIEAVGAGGRSTPLPSFEQVLTPQIQ